METYLSRGHNLLMQQYKQIFLKSFGTPGDSGMFTRPLRFQINFCQQKQFEGYECMIWNA